MPKWIENLLLLLLLTVALVVSHQQLHGQRNDAIDTESESEWVGLIRDVHFPDAKTEYVLWDRSRVDLLLPTYAVEADWEYKWAEGIGQASLYGRMTNRKPVVLILIKRNDWQRYVSRCLMALPPGFEMWVFDTRDREWIVPPPPGEPK